MWHEDNRVYMNADIHIKFYTDLSEIEGAELLDSAFEQFAGVMANYTRFNPTSYLGQLNTQGTTGVQVSAELFNLVSSALEIAAQSNGAFDPTVIDFLEKHGYGSNIDKAQPQSPSAYTRSTFNQIELDKSNHTIKLMPNQRLDLGGIGKGFAIDLAGDILSKCSSYYINAGGDIKVKGTNPNGQKWQIGISDKSFGEDEQKIIDVIALGRGAIACSGGWARKLGNAHHLINPKTGGSDFAINEVYTRHQSAMLADAWATAIYVNGSVDGMQLPLNLEWMIVNARGILSSSDNFYGRD